MTKIRERKRIWDSQRDCLFDWHVEVLKKRAWVSLQSTEFRRETAISVNAYVISATF